MGGEELVAEKGKNGELLFTAYKVSLWDNEIILEMDNDVMVAQQCELNYIL